MYKPIQIAFPNREYPLVTKEERDKMISDPAISGKYRFEKVGETPNEEVSTDSKEELTPKDPTGPKQFFEPVEARKKAKRKN